MSAGRHTHMLLEGAHSLHHISTATVLPGIAQKAKLASVAPDNGRTMVN